MNAQKQAMQNLAKQLHLYIRARAQAEGKGYSLTAKMFEEWMREKRTTNIQFFGVVCQNGKMLYDEQEPSENFFDNWMVSRRLAKISSAHQRNTGNRAGKI